MSIRRDMVDGLHGGEDLIFLTEPEFDAAIIGVAERAPGRIGVAYDVDKVIQVYMDRDGMTYEEANEFFSFNTLSAYVGENSPVFVTRWWGTAA